MADMEYKNKTLYLDKLHTDSSITSPTIDELKNNISELEFINKPIHLFPETDLPCVNFQFDDAVWPNDNLIANVFKEYGLTCGFAFPSSSLSLKDHYLKLQSQGFSILNHSIDGNPFGDKIITITDVNITDGNGTISGTVNYGGITLTFPEYLNGKLFNCTTGDSSINFDGITKQSSIYTFNVFGVIENPSIGGKFTYRPSIEQVIKIFSKSKYDLENAGLIVNGWVSPSSTMNGIYLPYLKKFHTYAFTSYASADATMNGRNQDMCNLHRFSIESKTLEDICDFIDLSIQNDQLISFIGHGYNIDPGGSWTLDKLRNIIEYCIEKRNNGELWIGNPDNCIRNFFKI